MERSDRYEDSLIFERKPFTWPGGRTLAVWVIPNVEVYYFDAVSAVAITPNVRGTLPDVVNYTWKEYGMRVGLWRIADVLDDLGIRATVALNSDVCEVFPRVVEAMTGRRWELMGHGVNNNQSLATLAPEEEKAAIEKTLGTIERFTGERPRGWLGPGLAETHHTPDLLAAAGVCYVGDWCHDDQPFPLRVKGGEMTSLPYCMEINDIPLVMRKGYTGREYFEAVLDQFDALYADSPGCPRVLGLPLHPFITGQPLRIRYLKKALQHMKRFEGVWFATGSEIIDWYRKQG
ncbi:MAG TPA: polysaccharide deacetylase family protein [Candidatus Binatia bacterium]